jgi:16S rRNA (guanine527-N7)-methyltransferase
MPPEARAALVDGARELRLPLDDAHVDRLLALLELVTEWNAKFNLTAIREPLDMVRKHLLDSLTVQPYVVGPFVTDVGTGAGFPGLPLAIVNPQLRFTLVDSIQKKIRFVEHAVGALALDNVEAVAVRAESWHPEQRATTVVSRALAALPTFVAQAGHLCARNGRLLAMKGRHPSDEIAALPRGWKHRVERLHVPGLADDRTLVILERDGDARDAPGAGHGR